MQEKKLVNILLFHIVMVYVGLMAHTGPSERDPDLPGVCPVSTIIIIIVVVVVVEVSMFVFGFSMSVHKS